MEKLKEMLKALNIKYDLTNRMNKETDSSLSITQKFNNVSITIEKVGNAYEVYSTNPFDYAYRVVDKGGYELTACILSFINELKQTEHEQALLRQKLDFSKELEKRDLDIKALSILKNKNVDLKELRLLIETNRSFYNSPVFTYNEERNVKAQLNNDEYITIRKWLERKE